METRNLIYEKKSYFFLLWRNVPLNHVPFSVMTSYRLNEHEGGIHVSGEAKCLFLLLHVYKWRCVQLGFCPVDVVGFMLCGKVTKGQI